MEPVVVVGAGLAGVACARELAAAGLPVRVLDRGHRPGGRMASRTLDGRPVDLGASYFTVGDDSDFAAVVEDWRSAALAREWTDTFTVLEAGSAPEAKTGPTRWGTPHGTRSLVEHLAAGLDVVRTDVRRVTLEGGRPTVNDAPASSVVLAMPDPQARRLLEPGPVADRLDRTYEPVLALAARFARRTWDDGSPDARFEGAFVNQEAALDWVADDGRRRGDDAPVLVAHSTAALAVDHLEDPAAAEPEMLDALRRHLDVDVPTSTYVHRWTYAKPAGEREERFLLDGRLGVCGDGWGPSPKVETAWRSGRDLGRALAERLA
ncbi:hypothetical protein GCM10011519_23630 [Marmoricola endophyticus]|uniref:Amine oxidase domain-containing protein n=1 Tax=Marmoricola endophyticus TaxID=2040280 RepID=A0A917F3C2_9ACTN|nr:FAD-dependent oxidoreductase [Marmoricola endophyticus]GGF48898.1 hypothetical protein GCM10011519_23630 [Marmoricola endophyticus]